MRYLNTLQTIEKRLLETGAFVREVLPHNGEIGSEVEVAFRSALTAILPERIGVTSGFVTDSKGNISNQLDVIFFDKFGAPKILDGEIAVLPAECTYAAAEVKTTLGKSEFSDAFKKCESFKRLDRSAQFYSKGPITKTFNLYGEEERSWPPLFFLLSLQSSKTQTFHSNALEALTLSGASAKSKIDVAISLDGNTKINGKTVPHPDQSVTSVLPKEIGLTAKPGFDWLTYKSERPWVLFSTMLIAVMTQAPSTSVNMHSYLGNAQL